MRRRAASSEVVQSHTRLSDGQCWRDKIRTAVRSENEELELLPTRRVDRSRRDSWLGGHIGRAQDGFVKLAIRSSERVHKSSMFRRVGKIANFRMTKDTITHLDWSSGDSLKNVLAIAREGWPTPRIRFQYPMSHTTSWASSGGCRDRILLSVVASTGEHVQIKFSLTPHEPNLQVRLLVMLYIMILSQDIASPHVGFRVPPTCHRSTISAVSHVKHVGLGVDHSGDGGATPRSGIGEGYQRGAGESRTTLNFGYLNSAVQQMQRGLDQIVVPR